MLVALSILMVVVGLVVNFVLAANCDSRNDSGATYSLLGITGVVLALVPAWLVFGMSADWQPLTLFCAFLGVGAAVYIIPVVIVTLSTGVRDLALVLCKIPVLHH